MKLMKILLIITGIIVIIVLALFLLFRYNINNIKDKHNLQADIDNKIEAFIRKDKSYGMVIGVFKANKEYIKAYNQAQSGKQVVNENSIFELASSSKLFTTSCLQILADKNALSLQDPISKELGDRVALPPIASQTTLLHLATHQSGLPSIPQSFESKMTDEENPYKNLTINDLYDYLKDCDGKQADGTFEYSNLGMGLLGHLMALNQNKSYERLVKDELLAPLQMHHTFVSINPAHQHLIAQGYDATGKPSPVWEDTVLTGAGSFLSDAKDMLCFIKANLNAGYSPVSPSLQKTHEAQLNGNTGLGWILGDGIEKMLYKNDMILWHNGMAGGYSSFIFINKTQNYGFILLSDKAEDVTELGMRLAFIIKHQSWAN